MPARSVQVKPYLCKMSFQQKRPQERLSCPRSNFPVQTTPVENLSLDEDKLTQTDVLARAIALQLTQEHPVNMLSL